MCRRAEGEKETGLLAGWDAGLRSGGGISDWSFLSDFTNEMGRGFQSGRVGSERPPCLALPKIAIHGNFSLGY